MNVFSVEYTGSQSASMEKQGILITGEITDDEGSIPGVNVVVKGTSTGVVADMDGKYSITVPDQNSILQFSYLGFVTQEITVGDRRVIDVLMVEETMEIDEVVVVGYGIQRKRDLTGAVSQIKAESLQKEHPGTIQNLLRANVPGLNIGFANEAQGGGTLEIRGNRSLAASAEPLLVVDGIIYYGGLNEINPNDVEQIDVLKDASSLAVYGAKAAQGVIIITTRKGTSQKPVIRFNANVGASTLGVKQEVYGPEEFLSWREDVMNSYDIDHEPGEYSNPNNLPAGVTLEQWRTYSGRESHADNTREWLIRLGLMAREIDNYFDGRTYDWHKGTYRTGLRQDYNVDISGSREGVSYFWSLGYMNNNGVVRGDWFKTYRSRLKLDFDVTKWLSAGVNINYSNRDNSAIAYGMAQVWGNTPYATPTDKNGNPVLYPTGQGDTSININSEYENSFIDRSDIRNSFTGTMYAKLTLPFGITYQMNFSPRYQVRNYRNHRSSEHPTWASFGGDAERRNWYDYNWQIDNLIKWQREIDRHRIDVTLLQNAEKGSSWEERLMNENFEPSDALGYHRMQSGTSPTMTSNDEVYTGAAYMGRLFYSFDNKYLFTASVRRDGYSAFGQSNPWAVFPSVALGWVFSEESFFNLPVMDYGKLRLSWGKNGNRSIGQYRALSDMGTQLYFYQDASGTGAINPLIATYVNRMGNSALKWETTTSYNIGLDFGFIKNRIAGTVELYQMNTTDLLVNRQLANLTGFGSVMANLGEVQNRGFEIQINSLNYKRDNFTWSTSASFSLNRNKILHLWGEYKDGKEVDDMTENNEKFIGHAIDAIWTYNVIGVWQTEEKDEAAKYGQLPGDIKIKKNDTSTTAYSNADKEFIGYYQPRFRWTLRNEFTFFKNWSASFMLYSYWGHKAPFHRATHFESATLNKTNYYKIPYWTPENPTNRYARLYSDTKNIGANFFRKLSFIRLDNISVSYALPQNLLNRFGIARMDVFASVRNVGFWAPDWEFYDPEAMTFPARGDNGLATQEALRSASNRMRNTMRDFTIGVNLSL